MRTGKTWLRWGLLLAAGVVSAQASEPAAAGAWQTPAARPAKILYIEGEPRAEMKFLNRAMADAAGVRVVILQRTADHKYLRLGVDSASELADGFPTTRAELFAYSAIVLGSIEASAFDSEQHRLLAAFVTEHGGGLLALGGAHAFGAGGWDGTPISALLPIDVEPSVTKNSGTVPFVRLAVQPTAEGLAHPAMALMATLGEPKRVWPRLPPLTSLNPVYVTRPGAAALLTALDASGREAIVLAVATAGAGRTAAFTVQDSWQWQMHEKTVTGVHERFWQGLLAWLAGDVR